jgi:hypothetical protein
MPAAQSCSWFGVDTGKPASRPRIGNLSGNAKLDKLAKAVHRNHLRANRGSNGKAAFGRINRGAVFSRA